MPDASNPPPTNTVCRSCLYYQTRQCEGLSPAISFAAASDLCSQCHARPTETATLRRTAAPPPPPEWEVY